MFDIKVRSLSTVRIDSLAVCGNLGNLTLYACEGSFVGNETNESAWTVVARGWFDVSWDDPVDVTLDIPWTIPSQGHSAANV
jgi:hypothetical protein